MVMKTDKKIIEKYESYSEREIKKELSRIAFKSRNSQEHYVIYLYAVEYDQHKHYFQILEELKKPYFVGWY